MGLSNHNIRDLNGGVSQQPSELRFDNQVESMDNCLVTVAQGLRRRNPIAFLAALDNDHHANTAIHSYNRGDGEKQYGITICEHGLKVYDPSEAGGAGFSKTIHSIGATDVITSWLGTNWKKDIQFTTVGDTTWILNKSKVITSQNIAQVSIPHAFFWISKTYSDASTDGGTTHGHSYKVVLDGITFRAVYPSDTQWLSVAGTDALRAAWWGFSYRQATGYKNLDQTDIQGLTFSDSILAAKALQFYINDYGGYTSRAESSILYIKKTDESEFTFEYGDSWGDQASRGWTDSVSKLADLPYSMDGFTNEEVGVVAISGTDTDTFTNYYLGWEDDRWREVHGIGMEIKIDKETLPAKLVQIDDDTFEIGFVDDYLIADAPAAYTTEEKELFVERWSDAWNNRLKGDDDSNPIPSFVGRKIKNMFFFKNRLGFTSEDNVILSESGSYYNFFATTAMDIIDNDPIDAGIDSNTVSVIRSVNTTAGALTLWSDNAQFLMSGGEILSPATTRIGQTSSYAASNDIEPIVVDNEILFFNVKGDWLETSSYNPASLQADKSSAESISAHIPEYVPKDIDTVCVASASNLVLLFSKAQPTKIFVYKYYINNNERKISAWFTWTFDENIIDIEVLNNSLFILANINDTLVLELEPIAIDGTFLDRGVTPFVSDVVLSKYNVMTNQDVMTTREPFYMKNIKVNKQGKVDFVIINEERNKETIVNNKHLGRKLVIGGNTNKVSTGFRTSYDTGCEINTISLEGRLQMKSRNI